MEISESLGTKIFVKTRTNKKKISFKFEESATINDVKSAIYNAIGIVPEGQTISLQGKHFFLQLEDEKRLSDYNIQKKSVLHLFPKEESKGTCNHSNAEEIQPSIHEVSARSNEQDGMELKDTKPEGRESSPETEPHIVESTVITIESDLEAEQNQQSNNAGVFQIAPGGSERRKSGECYAAGTHDIEDKGLPDSSLQSKQEEPTTETQMELIEMANIKPTSEEQK